MVALFLAGSAGIAYFHRSAVTAETEARNSTARITELKTARDAEIAEMKRRTESVERRLEDLCSCK